MDLDEFNEKKFWMHLEANDLSPRRTMEALRAEYPEANFTFNEFGIAARMYQEMDRYKAKRKLKVLMAETELLWITEHASDDATKLKAIKMLLDSPHGADLGYEKAPEELTINIKNLPAWATDELPSITPKDENEVSE